MANPFDQFDEPAPQSASNPFDRFDEEAQPAAAPAPQPVPNPAAEEDAALAHAAGLGAPSRPLPQGVTPVSADNIVRSIANYFTGGGADYLAGQANAAIAGGDADQAVAQERARTEAIPAREKTAGKVLSAVGMGLSPALQAGRLVAPATRLGRAAVGTAEGAFQGGVISGLQGAADATGDVGGRANQGLKEALWGAVIGAPLGGVAGSLARAGAPAFTSAEKRLLGSLKADNVDVAALPEGGALIDAGGDATARLARTINTRGNPAAARLAENLQARAGSRADRLRQGVADSLSGKNFYGSADELIAARSEAAGPLYEKAFAEAQPVDTGPLLSSLDERLKTAKGGINTVLQKARGFLVDGRGVADTSLQGLHEAKLALDDAIDAASKDSSFGRLAKRELIDVRNKLVAAIDEANPAYGEARAAYAGPSQSLEALDIGRSLIREDAELGAKEIAKLSPGDKEFAKIGVARALTDAIAKGEGKPGLAKSLLAGDKGKRIRAVFDSDDEFQTFVSKLEAEAQGAAREQFIQGGSQTAARQTDAAALDNFAKKTGRVISAPFETAGRVAEWAVDKTAQGAINRRQAGIDDELVNLMTDPKAAKSFIGKVLAGQDPSAPPPRPGIISRILLGYGPPGIIDRSK